jgi:Tol biopolymer transport system component
LGCGPESYHGRFLASWAPDGSRAAAVPNLLEEIPDSGIWVFDAKTGRSEQILALNDGRYCIHPQWSPFADEILFATLSKDEGETKDAADTRMPYSIWVIGAGGYGLRRIAEGTSLESSGDSDIPRIALPNTVAWGAVPGTVIFQKAVGDRVTAVLLDPYTGRMTEFLPHPADAYSIEPSPSRRQVAAVLYDERAQAAEVFLSDFGFDNWRRLATIGFDADQLDVFSPMIYWSPDSTRFVMPEEDRGLGLKGKPHSHLRLFDVRSGGTLRIPSCNTNSAVLWDEEGRSFYFSGNPVDGDSDSVIYRVESESGWKIPVVPAGNNILVSWNRADGRIYFCRKLSEGGPEDSTSRALYSCASDGSDVQELSPWLESDQLVWGISPDGSRILFLSNQPRLSLLGCPGTLGVHSCTRSAVVRGDGS